MTGAFSQYRNSELMGLLGAARATPSGGDVFREPVSIKSHYGPNLDIGLCEVKARGETE